MISAWSRSRELRRRSCERTKAFCACSAWPSSDTLNTTDNGRCRSDPREPPSPVSGSHRQTVPYARTLSPTSRWLHSNWVEVAAHVEDRAPPFRSPGLARTGAPGPPAIVVGGNEGAAASRALDDVLFRFLVAINNGRVQARLSGDVDEMCVERAPGRRSSRRGLGRVTSHTLLREQPIHGKGERGPYSKSDKATTAPIHRAKGPGRFAFVNRSC